MAQTLTDDLHGVLQSLLGVYGKGQPDVGQAAAIRAAAAQLRAGSGAGVLGYTDAHGMQRVVAESHANKDGVTRGVVAESGAGTVNGRKHIANQIAEFQARARALAAVADTRFSGPALLASAQTTIANATRRVTADAAAAREQAARIMPPAAPQPTRRRRQAPVRRRRRRYRPRSRASRSAARPRPRAMMKSDGTAGGNAVSAASAWLGTPYVWGGGGAGGPSGGGFDCSGLTQYAIAQASDGEVVLPRTTYEQIYSGTRIHPSDVRPGDLVFPASSFSARGPEHVQLAAGNGMVIEAPYSGSTVRWSQMPSDAVVIRVL